MRYFICLELIKFSLCPITSISLPDSGRLFIYALKLAQKNPRQSILVNLSGRGDKDIDFVVDKFGLPK